MKDNHNQFEKTTKGQFNAVREFAGYLIRKRCWDSNPWQIVDSKDFDTANIIKDFYCRDDLWDFIKANPKDGGE